MAKLRDGDQAIIRRTAYSAPELVTYSATMPVYGARLATEADLQRAKERAQDATGRKKKARTPTRTPRPGRLARR